MRIQLISAFILFFAFFSMGQVNLDELFSYPSELSDIDKENYSMDYSRALDSMYYHSKYKNSVENEAVFTSINKIKALKYASYNTAIFRQRELEAHGLYYKWPEAEEYVVKVLKKIAPNVFSNQQEIRVYILRSSYENAYALDAKEIYITVGLLANMANEAELAFILGHELGHILSSDNASLAIYRGSQIEKYGYGAYPNLMKHKKVRKNLESKHQLSEIRADSFGLAFMANAKYDISGAEKALSRMRKNKELWKINTSKRIQKSIFNSHPSSEKRMSQVNYFAKNNKGNHNVFLVSESSFYKIKIKAKKEQLIRLRSEMSFYGLMDKSFDNYLENPKDTVAVYYLLEGLRQYIGLYPNNENSLFLLNKYSKNGVKSKLTFSELLALKGISKEKVKNGGIYKKDNLRIDTYENAWKFFKKLAIKLKINESLLTIALKEKRYKYMKAYSTNSNSKFVKAGKYLFGKDEGLNETHKYVLINNSEWLLALYPWNLYTNQERYNQAFSYGFYSHMENYQSEESLLFVSDVKNNDFKDFVSLRYALSNAHGLVRVQKALADQAKRSEKVESYSFLWFWPEYYPLMEKFDLGPNITLIKDRRYMVKLIQAPRLYDYYIQYDVAVTYNDKNMKCFSKRKVFEKKYKFDLDLQKSNYVYKKTIKFSKP